MSTKKKKTQSVEPQIPVEPRRPGAPSKLDGPTKKTLLDEIAAGASYNDAAVLAGIDVSTFKRWRAKGEGRMPAEGGDEAEYRAFCAELDAARVRRRRWYRTTIAKIGLEKKEYRAIAHLASVTEPEEFAPKIHVIVEQQFADAIARLKEEYADEPELLERTIAAIIGANAGARVSRHEDGAGGESDGARIDVSAAQAIAAADGVSGSDV